MKRQYRITRCNLGYNIYRKREEDWLLYMERLEKKGVYSMNKNYAKTFYNLNDAESFLVIEKIYEWKQETDTTSEKKPKSDVKRKKQSWSSAFSY